VSTGHVVALRALKLLGRWIGTPLMKLAWLFLGCWGFAYSYEEAYQLGYY
jgi:hypothetical protein